MAELTYTIKSPNGLHARPVCALAALLGGFESQVTLACGGRRADGRDPIAVLALGAGPGKAVAVSVRGRDETACAAAIADFFRADWEG